MHLPIDRRLSHEPAKEGFGQKMANLGENPISFVITLVKKGLGFIIFMELKKLATQFFGQHTGLNMVPLKTEGHAFVEEDT